MAEEKKKNKSFVLRVDSATMEALEKWAADEFRSVNGQLQWIIAEALRRNRRLPARRSSLSEGGGGNVPLQEEERRKDD